ncbi:MAG: PorV/PorQ family protein [bacterium]
MQRIFLVLLILTMASSVYGRGKGESGAAFLKIGQGARALAMGEAYVAVADDPYASCWNPAGLAMINAPQFGGMYGRWFQDIATQHLTFARPAGNMVLGAGITMLQVKNIEEWKDENTYSGNFNASDMAIILSGARKVNTKANVGANLKLISTKIKNESASAWALDLGGLYHPSSVKGLSIGVSLQNLGTSLKFKKEKDPLPFNIKIGCAYRLFEERLIVAGDLNSPNDADINIRLGTEYTYPIDQNKLVAIRAGYREGDDSGKLTVGCGLQIGNFQFDYAYLSFGNLDSTHRVSLIKRF